MKTAKKNESRNYCYGDSSHKMKTNKLAYYDQFHISNKVKENKLIFTKILFKKKKKCQSKLLNTFIHSFCIINYYVCLKLVPIPHVFVVLYYKNIC